MLRSSKWIVLLTNAFFVLFSGFIAFSTWNSPQTWKPKAALAALICFSVLLIACILALFLPKRNKIT